MSDITELKPYEFYGCDFTTVNGQGKTDCPFCNKTKFYVSHKTGQYQCKSCGMKGNKYSFLTEYHKLCLELRTDKEISAIVELRDNCYSNELIKEFGLCFDLSGNVLLPQKSPTSKGLTNLRKWNPDSKIAYNAPSCCSLFFARWDDDPTTPVTICEGEWDALALVTLMQRAKADHPMNIVSVPGANVFKESWLDYFKGRDVILIFDNDHDKKRTNGTVYNPAKDGMKSATTKLGTVAKSIRVINWSLVEKDLPDGYDIRDHLKRAIKKKKSKRFLDSLYKNCEKQKIEAKDVVIPDLKRESFAEVVEDFRKVYSVNQSFIDCLAMAFASIVSLRIKGNPLWVFVVGPPSSGKTSIIEAFERAYAWSKHVSKLTATSLVSGAKVQADPSDEDDEDDDREDSYDPSMLKQLRDKVLFVKDFTTVIDMGVNDKNNLFGILRDAYDGRYVQQYGNGVRREYKDLYFGVFAGVTHAINGESKTSLGERFLRINIIDDEFVEADHIRRALTNVTKNENQKPMLQGSVNGFLRYLSTIEEIPELEPDSDMFERLIALSQFVAAVRTTVQRINGRDMSFRPETEIGSRIATQLSKAGAGIAMVLGYKEINDEVFRVMMKLALNSSVGWQLEVIQILVKFPNGMSAVHIAEKMNVHPNQIRKIVEDMMQLNLIRMVRVSNNSGNRGNKLKSFKLTEEISELIKTARIVFNDKIETYAPKAKRNQKKNQSNSIISKFKKALQE